MEVNLRIPSWATHFMSDMHGWTQRPLPVADLAPFDLPDDAWFEYAWLDADGQPRPDPGGVSAGNPWWDYACRITGPRWRDHVRVPAASVHSVHRLRGHRLDSRHFGSGRRIYTYSPAGADTPAPVLLIHDGKGFWHHGRCGVLADALLAAGEIPPVHLVFLQPARRTVEYAFNPAHAAYVIDDVLPYLDDVLVATDERLLLGASLGALAAAHTALDHPGVFAAVGSLSGTFPMGPGDEPIDPFTGSEWLLGRLRDGAGHDLRWHLDCGTLEWLLPRHERLCEALVAGGYDHRCLTRNVGHNWTNWRNALPETMKYLLAG